MKLRRPHVKAALPTLAVIAIIAVSAVVWHSLPTPTDVLGPFDVRGEAGTPVVGRGVSATVTSVRITPEVDSVKPGGIWVVVNAELEGTRSTELPHSDLLVGPNTYTPSDLFFTKTFIGEINPGITQRGSWIFDVAPALVAPGSTGPMTLRMWVGDGRLDSRLVIDIPLNGSRFSREAAVTLMKPEESAS